MKGLRNSITVICLTLFTYNIGIGQGQLAEIDRDSITMTLPPSLLTYEPSKQNNQQNYIMRSPYENWGFICKWEVENDMKKQIPLRFRLGTLDYVNKYEKGIQ